MEIYLVNKKDNSVVQTFKNVTDWGFNYVEYYNLGKAKTYINTEEEYLTDTYPTEVANDTSY